MLFLRKLLNRVYGLQGAFITDREGIVIAQSATDAMPKQIVDANTFITFATLTDQAAKMGLGKNKTIVTYITLQDDSMSTTSSGGAGTSTSDSSQSSSSSSSSTTATSTTTQAKSGTEWVLVQINQAPLFLTLVARADSGAADQLLGIQSDITQALKPIQDAMKKVDHSGGYDEEDAAAT